MGLLNPDFARWILGWQHSGFSIESGTRILDQPMREALCEYLVRAPLSLQRIRWDEQQDTITWSASPSRYFKGKVRRYSSLDFIAQVTLHVPPGSKHLVRRYSLYSSRGRGTWKSHPLGGPLHRPALRSRAPANWHGRKATAGARRPLGGALRRPWIEPTSHLTGADPLGNSMSTPTSSGFMRVHKATPPEGDHAIDRNGSSAGK